jgi:hypothetical protein
VLGVGVEEGEVVQQTLEVRMRGPVRSGVVQQWLGERHDDRLLPPPHPGGVVQALFDELTSLARRWR